MSRPSRNFLERGMLVGRSLLPRILCVLKDIGCLLAALLVSFASRLSPLASRFAGPQSYQLTLKASRPEYITGNLFEHTEYLSLPQFPRDRWHDALLVSAASNLNLRISFFYCKRRWSASTVRSSKRSGNATSYLPSPQAASGVGLRP